MSKYKVNNLYEGNINFDNNDWINEKYKKLINNQITQDLITDNILSFYEKKIKLKSNYTYIKQTVLTVSPITISTPQLIFFRIVYS